MAKAAADPTKNEATEHAEPAGVLEEVGTTLFPELVWAHYEWERHRRRGGEHPDLRKAYEQKLDAFNETVGDITRVYWSTRRPSAVAMTEKRLRGGWLLWEADDLIKLHRVTDWVTRNTPGVADVLHECDALSIRVGEILRGPSERIAMRWILSVQEHLLGFFERAGRTRPDDAAVEALVKAERAELAQIDEYYRRAGAQAGRIVYFTGMLIGTAIAALIALVALVPLAIFGVFGSEYETEVGLLYLCFGSGAVGALVSVMYRLRNVGGFTVDVEVGRPLIRRLGAIRPFVGATSGMLIYAMLVSGLLPIDTKSDREDLYFAVAAFFAGFSEQWLHVVMRDAEKPFGGGQAETEPSPSSAPRPPLSDETDGTAPDKQLTPSDDQL